MRAIGIREFGGPEKLQQISLPRPKPQRGELLLRIVAAGVNPVDCKIRAGLLRDAFPHALPLIPGWDAAGVIEEFGEGVSGYRKGDRVWACARRHAVHWGCYAEYARVPETGVAIMPSKLLFEEAAAMPLAGLAAYQALSADGGIGPDSTVLIHGAAGGVGHLALQLARDAGARVYGTAGPDSQSFVAGLGATAGIDYTREDFTDAIHRHCPDGVDVVLDTRGGQVLSRSYGVLKPGGRLVSLVEQPNAETAAQAGVRARLLEVEPDAEQLGLLAQRVDQGQLRPTVQKIFGLDQAAEAHRVQEAGHVRGKLVLNL